MYVHIYNAGVEKKEIVPSSAYVYMYPLALMDMCIAKYNKMALYQLYTYNNWTDWMTEEWDGFCEHL